MSTPNVAAMTTLRLMRSDHCGAERYGNVVPPVFVAFRQAWPGVRLAVDIANTHDIQDRLAAGQIDVALTDGGRRSLAADRVFLSLGTKASVPDVPGLVTAQPMTPTYSPLLPLALLLLSGLYLFVLPYTKRSSGQRTGG